MTLRLNVRHYSIKKESNRSSILYIHFTNQFSLFLYPLDWSKSGLPSKSSTQGELNCLLLCIVCSRFVHVEHFNLLSRLMLCNLMNTSVVDYSEDLCETMLTKIFTILTFIPSFRVFGICCLFLCHFLFFLLVDIHLGRKQGRKQEINLP